ncbi:MAG: heparinase II/III-family protein [Desulfobacterales bacterium]
MPDGTFPDYGDRDDGYIFRLDNGYKESPFPGLLNTAADFFSRPDWLRNCETAKKRLQFWKNDKANGQGEFKQIQTPEISSASRIKRYPEGGMTLMQWGKGKLLFRHAPLGMESTYAHGHADALSVIFYWDSIPVLIDLGSGQYNENQIMRNYFRSTIAHNTVEIDRQNQARILGPFMWKKSYETRFKCHCEKPILSVEASHNGYFKNYGVIHSRNVKWLSPQHIDVFDTFSGGAEIPLRGAFHLGSCQTVCLQENVIEAEFNKFKFYIQFTSDFSVDLYYGSKDPLIGWRSTIYGNWEPIYSILFTTILQSKFQYHISLKVSENESSDLKSTS